VTLLGEREDWVDIQTRLGKLKTLGPEPEAFGELLETDIALLHRDV
jgi:hypothetical protein